MRGSSYAYFYYSTALMAVLAVAQSHGEAPFRMACARMEENLVGIAAYTLCALCLRPASASRELVSLGGMWRGVFDELLRLPADERVAEILRDKFLAGVQAFVALTQETETNILACLAAKRLGVRKTVALVENLDYVSMAERLDIGTIINKKMIAASHIYKMMLDTDVANVKCLTFANADVAEFKVKEGSRITQKPIKDMGLPKGVTIGGLIRHGEGMLVTGNTMIQPGDHVVVFCLGMMIKKAEKFFN